VTVRLFVALDLPQAVRDVLARWGGRLAAADPALRPVRASSLHVTLCFLGSRPVEEIDTIGAACAGAVRPPAFELATGWLVGFPPKRPRVLAAAIEDRSRGLAQLQSRLSDSLAAMGVYQPERRPFAPHVTLARVKGRAGSSRPPGRPGDRLLASTSFVASSITLFSSTPAAGGSQYEPLRSAFLDVPS
jgi:2'-5' RNA ligase